MSVQKYRKKPVVVEAVQLRIDTLEDVRAFLADVEGARVEGLDSDFLVVGPDDRPDCVGATIPTLEGLMTATDGDYIIRGVKGEHYPCKPDIFEATYEPVDDG